MNVVFCCCKGSSFKNRIDLVLINRSVRSFSKLIYTLKLEFV